MVTVWGLRAVGLSGVRNARSPEVAPAPSEAQWRSALELFPSGVFRPELYSSISGKASWARRFHALLAIGSTRLQHFRFDSSKNIPSSVNRSRPSNSNFHFLGC